MPNRSPCAGSASLAKTQVNIDTITDTNDAVKNAFEICFLSILFSLILIIVAGVGFEPHDLRV